MTRVRFSGFPQGQQVTLSAAQGGVARGPVTVSAWKSQPMTINAWYPTNAVAPMPVWFEADVTNAVQLPSRTNGDVAVDAIYDDYDQQFHELEFEWSFGDTGTWQYNTRMPSLYRQKDYGEGKIACHVYSTPGDKTATCTVYYMSVDQQGRLGRTVVAQETFTFQTGGDAPSISGLDDVYPVTRRIYFDPAGDYSDVPLAETTGADLTANELSRCMEWAQNQSPTPAAVLIKAGSSVNWDSQAFTSRRTRNPYLYIGTYGSGARPLVNVADTSPFMSDTEYVEAQRGGHFTLDGIEVAGDWNSATESGTAGTDGFGGTAGQHHLAHNCILRNLGGTGADFQDYADGGQTAGERSLVLADTRITEWRDYGVFFSGSFPQEAFRQDVAIIGSEVVAAADTAAGLRNTLDSNEHGPVRIGSARHIYIRGSDFFSRSDWGAQTQACLRLNTLSPQQWEEAPGRTIVFGSSFEGGRAQILSVPNGGGVNTMPGALQPDVPGADRHHAWPINTLIKHNLFLGSWSVGTAVVLGRTAVSIIENVAVRPDVLTWQKTSADFIRDQMEWKIEPDAATATDGNGWVDGFNDQVVRNPARMIGNTTIDLKTAAPDDRRTLASIALAGANLEGWIEERDNTLYAPNYPADAVTSTGPWSFVEDITPRDTYGIRHDANVTASTPVDDNVAGNGIYDVDASYATPADGLKLYRPASGASIANASTGAMCHRDFFGTVRTEGVQPSQGAMEPT